MKVISFLKMSMATLLFAGLAGCSNDATDLVGGDLDNGTPGKTYFSINLSIPNDAPTFRAPGDLEGSPTDPGLPIEAVVSQVDLYFFKTDGTYVSTSSFTTELLPPIDQGGSTLVASTAKEVALEKDTEYDVCVLVNHAIVSSPGNLATFLQTAQLDPLAAYSVGFVTPTVTVGLPMAGRTTNPGGTDRVPPVRIKIEQSNTISAPAVLKFDAERSVAKLLLTPNSATNEYTLTTDGKPGSTTIATAQLQRYSVVNLMKTGFAFRHAVPVANLASPLGNYIYGNVVTDNHYIMDPQTHNKTIAAIGSAAGLYDAHVTAGRTYTGIPADLTNGGVLGYCYENTTGYEEQKNGYSTGLVFEAKITPVLIVQLDGGGDLESVTYSAAGSPANFYYYDGKFFKDLPAIAKAMNVNVTDLPSTPAALKLYSIETLTGGICYYNYWIKHLDNNDPDEMGIMEFGIVRNNVYRMKVTGISAVGSGLDVIIPEADNEIPMSYMRVEMTIMPWVVRAQEDITL